MSGKFDRAPTLGHGATGTRHWNLYRMVYYRQKAGWTQLQLGAAIGYTGRSASAMISRWETGGWVPRIDTQRRIASALGCRHVELMSSLPVLARESDLFTEFVEDGGFKTWAEYVDARGGLLEDLPSGDQ